MLTRAGPRRRAAAMRGLSLVELMVGVAVSLFVVAAAAMLVSTQLADNRRLLLETQLQQDLRATVDIVTRELRRTSYWENSMGGVPTPSGSAVSPNPMLAMAVSTSASASQVNYRYRRSSGLEAFGFKLNSDGVVLACQSDGSGTGGQCNSGWQEVTDPNTARVTEFIIAPDRTGARAKPDNDLPLTLPCPNLCASGDTSCWPKVAVRELTLTVTAESRGDPTVRRSLSSSVRLRNNRVDLSSEAPAGRSCPAG